MDVQDLPLPGLKLILPRVFTDARGFFLEPWSQARMRAAGLDVHFVQDNHSRSVAGTIRGMHFQRSGGAIPGQAKLVRCARGRIWDVVVDIRPGSATFGQHCAVELDDERHVQLFIPVGFAHGFCVLSDAADVCYKVSSPYDPATETGFRFDDPDVGIPWPITGAQALTSPRDQTTPLLRELLPTLG